MCLVYNSEWDCRWVIYLRIWYFGEPKQTTVLSFPFIDGQTSLFPAHYWYAWFALTSSTRWKRPTRSPLVKCTQKMQFFLDVCLLWLTTLVCHEFERGCLRPKTFLSIARI